MRQHLPSIPALLVLLIALSVLTQPAAATHEGSPVELSRQETDECARHDTGSVDRGEYEYVTRLDNASLDGWSDGDIARIGADGDCSLAVRNDTTATLTAAQVDTETGELVATLDLARDGTFRVGPADANATGGIVLANVGPDTSDRYAVLVGHENGSVSRAVVTLPSGRFVDVEMTWHDDGSVTIAFSEPNEYERDDPELTVRPAIQDANWTVSMTAWSYLDELAIRSRGPADGAGAGESPADSEGIDDDDPFENDEFERPTYPPEDGADGGGGASGIIMGPLLAFLGAAMVKFGYGFARFGERMDAIGSTTPWHEVEPAGWRVALTKAMGVLVVLAGIGWFLSAL